MSETSSSDLITARIADLGDWRGETLARVRALLHAADPDVTETWKWRGVPVWEDAFKVLIRAAVDLNVSSRAGKK